MNFYLLYFMVCFCQPGLPLFIDLVFICRYIIGYKINQKDQSVSYSNGYVTWRSSTQSKIHQDHGVFLSNELIDELLVSFDEHRASDYFEHYHRDGQWKLKAAKMIADNLQTKTCATFVKVAEDIVDRHQKYLKNFSDEFLMCA